MNSNFRRNLQTGFGISLFLLIASSVVSYSSIRNLIGSSEMVDRTNRIIMASENILSNIKDGETGQRGYLMTGQHDFMEPYNGAYERTMESFKELRSLTIDNREQQYNCDSLETLINKRFNILRHALDVVYGGGTFNIFTLREGLGYMQKIRLLVKKMQGIERQLLAERTSRLKRFTTYTPVFILVAAGLAILITILFFKRVSDQYTEKALLTEELDKKDKEIASRIVIIDGIAQKIASGDYTVRLSEEQNDALGSLSVSLNKMATSLNQSFQLLSSKEWLQSGLAQLSEKLSGEKTIPEISNELAQFVAEYTDSKVGAVYLDDGNGSLVQTGNYSLGTSAEAQRIGQHEGLVGQCFSSGREIILADLDEKLYTLFSGGQIRPRSIVLFPMVFEHRAIGVVELGTLESFTELHLQFFKQAGPLAATSINMANNRTRVRELLEETQAQSEELQVQHRELESVNSELEMQTEKLQTSEEELKVQQEELMETNQELEERSRLLEERNQLIIMRNLEIQKKSEELALTTRYKSEFLANMSHELRTPLNSILLLSRLLRENNQGNLSKEQIEYATVIQNSGNGLLQLIDEILDLSKIESGKLELEYENVTLADIINEMRMLFTPMAQEKNVELVITAREDMPVQIETDRLRLLQILKNLLSNALKFTNKGKIGLQIGLSGRSDKLIEFSVTDTGIGIPEEKQQLIFEAFQQADGSTKRKYGGTGLGLSISRQLARLLAGDISLVSEVDKGSVFTLTIPIHKSAEPFQQLSDPGGEKKEIIPGTEKIEHIVSPYISSEIPPELPDDRTNILSSDKVMLIVEDDTGFAKALLDFTRNKGFKAIHIVRGDQVLDMAKKYNPAGILLDIQLPVRDGFTVMNELKAYPGTRHIPVHIMSSFELKKESLTGGAVDFIQKPLAFEKMSQILDKIEEAGKNGKKKVLIVEDNTHHARALGYYLSSNGIVADISSDIHQSVVTLKKKEVNCVILDMGIPGTQGYQTLELIKQDHELENIPIIIFTGKSLSKTEEQKIRQYADTIVIKTAQSYQRLLSEVSLFLHLMENNQKNPAFARLGTVDEVLNGKTVLVADDDIRNIFALNKVLEKHKMRVLTAMDGKEALEMLRQHPGVDIVLMDMMMPEMDGYESIRKIRSNAKMKNLPVIAVTAKAMSGDRDKCIQAGASDYISKPVDTDQLISLMRVWLYESN